jgi:alpha-beta hydrolase superfamily lysophospholipase
VVRTSSDAAFGGLPLFGCGISLGGCVLVSAAHQMPGAFSGVVLLAPMLSLEKMKADPINALLRPLASLLAWLVPSLPIVAIPRNTMFPLIQVCVCACGCVERHMAAALPGRLLNGHPKVDTPCDAWQKLAGESVITQGRALVSPHVALKACRGPHDLGW